MKDINVVVFASGEGTNFEYLVKNPIEGIRIVGLVTENSHCKAFERAREYDIGWSCFEFPYVSDFLETAKADLLVLTGFMKILPKRILDKYPAINIHPGRVDLYPELKGKDPQKKAIELGLPQTGNVVHWVTEDIDGGEIIVSDLLNISGSDTEETLSISLKKIGYKTLSCALKYIEHYRFLAKYDRKKDSNIDVDCEVDRIEELEDFEYKEQYEELVKLDREKELMHLKKNKDYSPANIISTGEVGIVARMLDKILRIMNLVGWEINPKILAIGEPMFLFKGKSKEPKNESLEDAYKDLGHYSDIAIIFRRGKWGK